MIRTPSATITDLGTEFGVEVREGGSSEVHVITGAVDVAAREGTGHVRLCATGDGLKVARIMAGSPKIVTFRADAAPQHFVRAMPRSAWTIGTNPSQWTYPLWIDEDAAIGGVFVCAERSFPVDGTVTQYTFRHDVARTKGRAVTPLIFARLSDGRFVVTGIGESIAASTKTIQRAPFRLIAGSAKVEAGKHTFGHFDGIVAGDGAQGVKVVSRNPGVVDLFGRQPETFGYGGPWRFSTYSPYRDVDIKVGGVFAVDTEMERPADGSSNRPYWLSNEARTYAAQMTVQPEAMTFDVMQPVPKGKEKK